MSHLPASSHQTLWAVFLCAQWCGLCRDYRLVVEQSALRNQELRFAWVDIEDEADLVGDVDIETFPALLLGNSQGVRFIGPLLPHAETLSRLLVSLQGPGAALSAHTGLTQQLLEGLAHRPDLWIKNA